MNRNAAIKKDMLSMSSTVQQILRALYSCLTDHVLVIGGARERLMHKEQLVALMEQGGEAATLEDMFTVSLKEPTTRITIEDAPPDASLLVFVQVDGEEGETTLTTFGEYRERRLGVGVSDMPEWWGVPIPLIYVDEGSVLLNDSAERMIPGGAVAMARQIDRMKADRIVTIKENKKDRTFELQPLDGSIYTITDVSGDFEKAEDLVWWAAVGRSFVTRMQNNGLTVKRLSPFEDIPTDASEVIQCRWENEIIGRLVIRVPKLEKRKPAAEPAPEPKPTHAAIPEPTPAPEPEPIAEPAPEPAPAPELEPVREPEPEPMPEPIAEPKLVEAKLAETEPPAKKRTPVKRKRPAPKVEPEPSMIDLVEHPLAQPPHPEPEAIPEPEPEPDAAPESEPEPEQDGLRTYAAKTAYGIKSTSALEDIVRELEADQYREDPPAKPQRTPRRKGNAKG